MTRPDGRKQSGFWSRLPGARVVAAIRRPGESLLHRVMNAGIWAFSMRIVVRLLQLARTVILARLLTPDDFGLMGYAVIALLMVDTLSKTGFWEALIQRPDDPEPYIDTAWTVEVLRGLLLATLLFLLAPLVAAFFGEPAATPVIRVLSLATAINGFTNIAIMRFDRALQFGKVFAFEVTQRMTEVVVALVAAIFIRSVWALVIGVLAGSVARVTASFVLARRTPRFRIERDKLLALFRYGRWIFGALVLWFLTNELDDILVGRMLGAASLGLYRMAYTLSQSMVTEIAQTTNQVIFPAFSRMGDDRGRMKEGLNQATHFVAFVAIPAAAVFLALGEDLTRVLLGNKWLDMASALRILAIAGASRAIAAAAAMMFEGAGRPEIMTRLEMIRLAVLALVIYPAIATFGLVGAAIATVIASVAADSVTLVRAARFSGAPALSVAGAATWPLINAAITAGLIVALSHAMGPGFGIVGLVLLLLAAVATYFLAAVIASRHLGYRQLNELLARLRPATE